MNVEQLRNYCLSKANVTEGFPFDSAVLVFKIGGKIFALSNLEKLPSSINLKCSPEKSLDLQESYAQIVPGFHMNKKHWITVEYKELKNSFVCSLIDESYDLVTKSLTKRLRNDLNL